MSVFWHGTGVDHESSIRLHGLVRPPGAAGVYVASTRRYALVYACTLPGARLRGADEALVVVLELDPGATLALRADHSAPGYGAHGWIADVDVIPAENIVALEHVAVPAAPALRYSEAFERGYERTRALLGRRAR